MAKDIHQAVREICLWLPDTEEYASFGQPNFRLKGKKNKPGKTYATYVVNHHGDGRIALWLNTPVGAQQHYVKSEPKHFFVPPYVGPGGWLGVNLDKGIAWKRVADLVREAYEKVAPPDLAARIGKTLVIKPPTRALTAEQIDPMQSKRALEVVKELRKICGAFPEVTEAKQFGNPVWKAGKRVFAQAYCYRDQKLKLAFWVGVEQQGLYTKDKLYEVPAYMGHNGWIALDVSKSCNWKEVRSLAMFSYRHFALKRMLDKLND